MAKLGQHYYPQVLLLVLTSFLLPRVYSSATFTLVNKCSFTVWPGILSNAGISPLSETGFSLQSGESKVVQAPTSWGGRFWARTHCSTDPTTGKFTCLTGDCGSGAVECSGAGANPPATLAEFSLNGYSGMDFYDVSLVDGYNLPMLVVPEGGTGVNCSTTGCVSDLNVNCPSELRVVTTATSGADDGAAVACKSACEAFGTEEYCCSGAYGTPDVCKPSQYSQAFKSACPHAYSYAYDDRTSTFTCSSGGNYVISFCPAPNTSQKSSSSGQQRSENSNSQSDGAMVYEGAADSSSAPPSTCHVSGVAVVAFVAAIWRLGRLI